MRKRITDKDINGLCDQLNRTTSSPMKAWVKNEDGEFRGQIGNFHISYAYGGVELHRMENKGGGISVHAGGGHRPKRELFGQMHALLEGIRLGRRTR